MIQKTAFSNYPATLAELGAEEISDVSGGRFWSGTFEIVIDTDAVREFYDLLRDLFHRCCFCDD